ncbi:conserved hypothetical protein [Shewanella halifaxensis HAW-EB4]|uniref:Uncharacterized protein n=1 Tax=Shewanella halifaxensis (strain HAW-EB4) TaxID=458817 RepID=B0TT33_SHEHH|nr:hypothetical protein [Shewanella halifaxensis]ABZ76594.1 conserved hypothetical protein [Shewanella halifaxensis HAW-EB4]
MQTVSSTKLLSILSKVTIIGNANGKWDIPSSGATFIFNGTKLHDKQDSKQSMLINISNGPFVGSKSPFVVTAPFAEAEQESLTLQLIEIAESLEKELHCWPSTGLVTTVLMTRLSSQLNVKRMSLLPSLKRKLTMQSDDYLACMVHNWLGERRIALGLPDTKLNWPELMLTQPDPFQEPNNKAKLNKGQYIEQCPFILLKKVHDQAQFKLNQDNDKLVTENLKLLKYLAASPIEIWLHHSTQEKLLACELMFFNQTPEQTSSFWYLVDNQASQYLDSIRHRLAYCQQATSTEQQMF